MHKAKILTNSTEFGQDEISTLVHEIKNSLATNIGSFPALPVAPGVVLSQIGEYDRINGLAEYVGKTEDLAAERLIVDTTFHKNGVYINELADGNATILARSGYPRAKEPTPVGELPPPDGMKIGHGGLNEFTFDIDVVEHAKGYLIAYTGVENPEANPYNWTLRWTSSHKATLGGFTNGKKYKFASAAVATALNVHFFISAKQLTSE